MNVSRARVEEVVRALVHEVRTEKLTFMAGSIAYHAFLSILPLLLLVLTIVQRIENVALRESIDDIMLAVLTQQASEVVQQGLSEAGTEVGLLGVAFLVWGTLRIFRGLDTAFSDIYETEAENTFTDQLGDGLLLLGTVALAILIASAISSLFALTGGGLSAGLIRGAVTAAGLFVVFYPMYYVFPDTDVTAVEVVPGVAFAAVGLTVAQVLFTTFKSGGAGDSLVASILVLLTWLYLVGLVILLGAAINAVLSNRSTDVDIDPVIGGVVREQPTAQAIDREALIGDLDALAERLRVDSGASDTDGGSLTVTIDGEPLTVDRPRTVTVDRNPSAFGLDRSVGLELRWWPDDG